ncbi:MAG TPA: DUF502 domain-containing protein [Tepidisphaeraceae bacterium]|nr:DUF502 domain-containing protein [Tepidisphaeraceae bacterium]
MTNERKTFTSDFRRFFVSGLKTLLPTLITIWLVMWVWNFLWDSIGRHIIWGIKIAQYHLGGPTAQWGHIDRFWDQRLPGWATQLIGVLLAVILVYLVGLLVGNLIGRTFWKVGEAAVMRIPVVRAIYPPVKQVTDFFLTDKRANQFAGRQVVAIQPHENGIWTIGLVTGAGPQPLGGGEEMLSVFCPNSPAAFSGYLMVVPRKSIIQLPLTVEEAMRLFISGGVIIPDAARQPAGSPGVPAVMPEVPARA